MPEYAHLTVDEIAELADEIRTDTHGKIADLLGVSRSSVSHALSDPEPRWVKLLSRIIELYGGNIDTEQPRYTLTRLPSKHEEEKYKGQI